MGYRLGIDVGGTFTDLVLFSEESGALVVGKVPSVPADPSQGIIDGIIKTLAAAARFSRAHLGLWKQTMGLAPAVPPPVDPMQRAYLSWQPEGAYQNPRRLRTSAFREAGREVSLPPRHRRPVWAEGEMILEDAHEKAWGELDSKMGGAEGEAWLILIDTFLGSSP